MYRLYNTRYTNKCSRISFCILCSIHLSTIHIHLLPTHARIPTILPVEPVEPLPPPTETPTLVGGYGFVRVGVRVALEYPRVTRHNPYSYGRGSRQARPCLRAGLASLPQEIKIKYFHSYQAGVTHTYIIIVVVAAHRTLST